MGRESLANRLAIKRKAGFLKTFNKRIETLKREKERLVLAVEGQDSLANQPWLDRIERTVQGFVGAGPVYGITPVSDWAKRSLEHIKTVKQSGRVPTEEDMNWITSMTQELAVLHSETMSEIHGDLTPEELAEPPGRISSLPLGAFPSARDSMLPSSEPKTEPVPQETAPPADEIETPTDQGTLPPEPIDPPSPENDDVPEEAEATPEETEARSSAAVPEYGTLPPERRPDLGVSRPSREPSIPPPTASVGGYTPPWETGLSPSEVPGSGVSEPIAVEASSSKNAEATIPLTIEDLTAVTGDRNGDRPPALLVQDEETAGKLPLGWKLLLAVLCVALLISLYFNWRSYIFNPDGADAHPEAVQDTGETGSLPAGDKLNGDPMATPDGKDTPPVAEGKESNGNDEQAASSDTPKKTTKKKSRSKRSKSRSKRSRSKKSAENSSSEPSNGTSSTRSDPRPSSTTGVLSILVPSYARGPVSITVDKRPKGKAPLKLALTPGLHEVVQTYKGTRTKRIVLIQKGRTKAITAKVPK